MSLLITGVALYRWTEFLIFQEDKLRFQKRQMQVFYQKSKGKRKRKRKRDYYMDVNLTEQKF